MGRLFHKTIIQSDLLQCRLLCQDVEPCPIDNPLRPCHIGNLAEFVGNQDAENVVWGLGERSSGFLKEGKKCFGLDPSAADGLSNVVVQPMKHSADQGIAHVRYQVPNRICLDTADPPLKNHSNPLSPVC